MTLLIHRLLSAGAGLLSLMLVATTSAQLASSPGQITTPYPTFEHISVEWPLGGDDNLNGRVGVRYRQSGAQLWTDNVDLMRVPAGSNQGFSWPNRHSGSVFSLLPGTAYEIELSLSDPDGGDLVQVIQATTRSIPRAPGGAAITEVTPGTLISALASASAGVVLQLQPGNYPGFQISRDGSEGMPIVLRGAAGAVINGEVGLFARRHIMLDQLTINGRIRFNGSDNISITRCLINASATQFNGDGIVAFGRTENAYIADNVVVGTSTWAESSFGVSGNNRGEGIALTGPGHVIIHNRVAGFRDNISFLEDSEAIDQFSIDVLNNDLSEGADDAIEADFCSHNCRIMRNRVTNAFIAFSSQPSLGGPNYFIRNTAYNVAFVAFKLQRNSEGDVLWHNTVVKNGDGLAVPTSDEVVRLVTRNNLIIGGPGGTYNGFNSGVGNVLRIPTLTTENSDLNHDALGSTNGKFSGRLGSTLFSSLQELRTNTTQSQAVAIDLGAFEFNVDFPANALIQYLAVGLTLAQPSAAIDIGQLLPGINSNFSGVAPDAGAIESSFAAPIYGPRPEDPAVFFDGFE